MSVLRALKDTTQQEVFNKVVKHLRTQRGKSQRDGFCRYRDGHGCSCAVGCLIADDEYVDTMESKTVDELNLAFHCIPFEYMELLRALQYTHDTFAVSEWEFRFAVIANMYNLTLEPLLSPSEG